MTEATIYIQNNNYEYLIWGGPQESCRGFWESEQKINKSPLSLGDCIDEIAAINNPFAKEIRAELEVLSQESQLCEIPDFDPLFSSIYSVVPVVFGCSIALKILKKIFSATD